MTKKTPRLSKNTYPQNSSQWRMTIFLPILKKALTAQITDHIYYSLVNRGQFQENRKEGRKGKRGIEDQQYVH